MFYSGQTNYSFPVLIILTIFLGTSPLGGQPHLLEKITMLMAGILAKPIDIFDLLMHATPIILLALKTIRYFKLKQSSEA